MNNRKDFDSSITGIMDKAQGMGLWDDGQLEKARVSLAVRRQVANNPKLRECTPESIARAALDAHLAGLMPDGREGYLVPRRNNKINAYECHFLASWRGIQSVACEEHGFRALVAEAVREGETFEWEAGLDPKIVHKPTLKRSGAVIGAYAIGFPSDGSAPLFAVADSEDLKAARATGGMVWKTHEVAMARKTAVRRLCDRVLHSETTRSRLAAIQASEDRMAELGPSRASSDRAAALGKAITGKVEVEAPPEDRVVHRVGDLRIDLPEEEDENPIDRLNRRMKALRTGEASSDDWLALNDEAIQEGLTFDDKEGVYVRGEGTEG